MVIDAFVEIFSKLQVWFIGLLGTSTPPAWMGTVGTFVGGLLQSAKGLGVWIPWTLIITVAAFNLALWAIFLAIKAARWLLGLIPTMGGG